MAPERSSSSAKPRWASATRRTSAATARSRAEDAVALSGRVAHLEGRLAREQGARWLLLLDQDTRLSSEYLTELLSVSDALAQSPQLGPGLHATRQA